jgi:hypothetical protein
MPDKTCGGKYRAERRDENRSPLFKLTKRGLRVNRLQQGEKREDNGVRGQGPTLLLRGSLRFLRRSQGCVQFQ